MSFGSRHPFLFTEHRWYYDFETQPLDIQCASQAVDALVAFSGRNPDALQLTLKVAQWTITNMQDNDGYFYHRRHSKRWVKKDAHAALGPGDDALRPRGPVQRLCNQKRMA